MSSTINTSYEVVKEFDTETLITFFKEKKLGLNENEIQIFRDQEIDGYSFLTLNEEILKEECKIRLGPRTKLVNLINNLNSQRAKRARRSINFLSDLKEILKGITSVYESPVTLIPFFIRPQFDRFKLVEHVL